MKLLEPGYIGKLKVKNRVVMAAMGAHGLHEEGGDWGERYRAYYETRAKGGVGLITTETTFVTQALEPFTQGLFNLASDKHLASMRKLADSLDAYAKANRQQLTANRQPLTLNELILLVDDEPSIIELARLYLEREGFRIQSVKDGEAALEITAREQPALLVLDVMLPKLDGFEVCRRLRASNSPTAILMLTARDEDIDKILGLELGADDYLTKPFNPRELVARVKAILRRGERKQDVTPRPSISVT